MDFHEAMKLVKKRNPSLAGADDAKVQATVGQFTELLHSVFNLGVEAGAAAQQQTAAPRSLFESIFESIFGPAVVRRR